MKRVILMLAAAVLGGASGCGRHCDFGTLELQLTFSDATSSFSCATSGTSFFVVFVDGGQVTDGFGTPIEYTCADGQIIDVNVADGTPHTIQIDAYDASQRLVYQFFQENVAARCGVTVVNADLIGVGDLHVAYTLGGDGLCNAPSPMSATGTTLIWFELRDQNGQIFSVADQTTNSKSIPCSSSNPVFTIPSVPFGSYTITGIEEAELDANGTSFIIYRYNCTPSPSFLHAADGDMITAPPMTDQAPGGTITCF